MGLFIPAYLAAVSLTALTVGWSAALARKSGQRLAVLFFFFVVVNDLAGLSDILFRLLPTRVAGAGPAVAGFLTFPLMAAFSYLAIDFELALVGQMIPKLLRRIFFGYWGLLFAGFLLAEYRHLVLKDLRLSEVLMPFFNAAIVLSGLGGSLTAFRRSRSLEDPGERRFVRLMSGFFFVVLVVFVVLFFVPLALGPTSRILIRGLLGFAYLLPLLAWLGERLRETRSAPLTGLARAGESLDRWLAARGLSPRECQIARCVLEGKTNAAIEKELFIGRRTVESHLYSIYQKLRVRNRLQLARLAAAETERPADSRPGGPL
jgi:DNA-binding CsgD family transcriptional regulator